MSYAWPICRIHRHDIIPCRPYKHPLHDGTCCVLRTSELLTARKARDGLPCTVAVRPVGSCACGILNPCSRYPRSAQGRIPFRELVGKPFPTPLPPLFTFHKRTPWLANCIVWIVLLTDLSRRRIHSLEDETLRRHSDIRLIEGISALGFSGTCGKHWHNTSTRPTHPSNLQLWIRLSTEYSTVALRLGHLLHGRWSMLLGSVWPTITAATMSTLLIYRSFNVFKVKRRQPGPK